DSPESSDLFRAVLTMMDPQVTLAVVPLPVKGPGPGEGSGILEQDLERARHLKRDVEVIYLAAGEPEEEIVRLARDAPYDLVIIGLRREAAAEETALLDVDYVVEHAPCQVCLVAPPVIPQEVS